MGTGDVAFSTWPLERRAVWIRSERINHVFHVVLIQQHEAKVTFCLNGQRSIASYSPRMTTKNKEIYEPRSMPSPF